jgi:hypothetical protein
MATTLRFTDADRDSDGKILTLDQLLLSSRAAIAAPQAERDDLADLLPPVAAPADQTIQRRPLTKAELATIAALGLLLVGLLAYLWASAPALPAAPPSRPAATRTSGGSAALPSPLPAAPPAMRHAYSAPDVPLGMIESTRAITPTAHYGAGWIQADVQGSGRIWLRASDWPELAIVGLDLTPRKATAAPAVVAPLATPEPQPPCLTAGTGAQVVTVCDWGDLEAEAKAKWIATYGGNAGVVTTPTPQEWNKP